MLMTSPKSPVWNVEELLKANPMPDSPEEAGMQRIELRRRTLSHSALELNERDSFDITMVSLGSVKIQKGVKRKLTLSGTISGELDVAMSEEQATAEVVDIEVVDTKDCQSIDLFEEYLENKS